MVDPRSFATSEHVGRTNPVHQANWGKFFFSKKKNWGKSSEFALFVLFTLPDPRYKDTARNTSAEASRLV